MVIRIKYGYVLVVLGIFVLFPGLVSTGSNFSETSAKFASPFEVLIIDPGHGGADGGAVGIDGTPESDINLSVGKMTEAVARLFGIQTVMTRDSSDISYPESAKTIREMKIADQKARLGLIRDYPHGILFSIHQNYYPDNQPSGVQVLFGHTSESRDLGLLMQSNLEKMLSCNDKRCAAEISDDIYLFRDLHQNAILIECGFLSNESDLKNLKSDVHQRKLAVGMIATYLQFTVNP